MAWTDSQILGAISYYYGTNSSLWDKIRTNNATWQEIEAAYKAIPQVSTVQSISGANLGIDIQTRFAQPPSTIDFIVGSADSSYQSSSYGGSGSLTGNVPSYFGGGGGSDYTVSSGALSGTGSTAQKVFAIADKLSLAVTGVNIGAKLGMKIDEALYSLNPSWWDEKFPTINPQTWTSIAGQSETGESFIRTLFGIKDDKLTPYVTDDVIAYVYQLFRDTNALRPPSTVANIPSGYTPDTFLNHPQYMQIPMPFAIAPSTHTYTTYNGSTNITVNVSGTDTIYVVGSYYLYNNIPASNPIYISKSNFSISGGAILTRTAYTNISGQRITVYIIGNEMSPGSMPVSPIIPSVTGTDLNDIVTMIYDGDISESSAIDGITPLPDGIIPDQTLIDGTDTDTIKQQLKQNYPDLFQDGITSTVPQSDGSLQTYQYYPIPWASDSTQTETQPTTQIETQTQTTVEPETIPELFPETEETLEEPPTIPPSPTGTGDTPETVIPIVEPSTLWAIYNPSSGEINSFGAWLWSANFIDNILKLFTNPMQAIISLHKIYCTPSRGSRRNIIVGYLDSGVNSDTVNEQYISFSCGFISLREYFGNVFDYSPFTTVHIYLPFIGIFQLNVADIMRGDIEVLYSVDVFTGACTAKINVIRDGSGGTIYEWSGNAAVFYPVSSGDYTGVIRGIMGAAGAVISGLSGNVAGAIGGITSAVMNSNLNVQRSGSFSGNAGAMNLRKPFLIISRPMPKMANQFNHYLGYPSNSTVRIGDCTGFIKMKVSHININNATANEIKEIEEMLLRGVIL